MFEKIKNDNFVIDSYQSADDPNSKDGFWVYHGLPHVNNVIEMVEKILIQLNFDEEYIENAKIAALLHDIGYGGIKKDHEIRSHDIAKKYFKDHKIKLKYEKEILESIKKHRDGFDSENIMVLALILADKIDIKYTRLTEEGRKIEGLNQYQYIEDIIIEKNNKDFIVNFLVNKRANRKMLEDWYFTIKVHNAIKSFANRLNLNLKILWNDEEWILN